MPRIARVVLPGVPHHVTQRGNRGLTVYADDADRACYLELLEHSAREHGLAIHAYCLMPDHVHLVVLPATDGALADTLGRAHLRYTQHVNRREGVTGRIWQGRFYSCPLDEAHHAAAVKYVELNPVRAGLEAEPAGFAWSSAPAHCGLAPGATLLAPVPTLPEPGRAWRAWLADGLSDELTARLRSHTRTGRPAGGAEFVVAAGETVGRSLVARPRGRPRKSRDGA